MLSSKIFQIKVIITKLTSVISFFHIFLPQLNSIKTLIKFRFVTCNTNCYNEQAYKIFFNYLNEISCEISKNDTCEIINNNHQVLNFLRKANNCKSIETFDFENLFTSVAQDNIRCICASLHEHDIQCFNCKKGFCLNLVKIGNCIIVFMECLTPFGTAAGDSRSKNRNKKCVKVDMQRYIQDNINFKEMTYNNIKVIRCKNICLQK